MALIDYIAKGRDKFELGYLDCCDAELSFPCCLCKFKDKEDGEQPCNKCDHNLNAIPEE